MCETHLPNFLLRLTLLLFSVMEESPDRCLLNLPHIRDVSDFAVIFVGNQSLKVGVGGSNRPTFALSRVRVRLSRPHGRN